MTAEFPNVIERLQGSDTNIEIVSSSMLQPLRIEVNCFPVVKSKAVIFVVEEMQRDQLKPLVFPNALSRAKISKQFLEKTLGLEDVKICQNFTKEQVVEVFE